MAPEFYFISDVLIPLVTCVLGICGAYYLAKRQSFNSLQAVKEQIKAQEKNLHNIKEFTSYDKLENKIDEICDLAVEAWCSPGSSEGNEVRHRQLIRKINRFSGDIKRLAPKLWMKKAIQEQFSRCRELMTGDNATDQDRAASSYTSPHIKNIELELEKLKDLLSDLIQ